MLKVLDFKGNFDDIAVKFSSRKADISKQVNDSVNDILEDVKKNGDKALMKYCRKFDGFMIDNPKDFVVTKQGFQKLVKILCVFWNAQNNRLQSFIKIKLINHGQCIRVMES